MQHNDADIMRRVKAGDVARFDELVRRYRPPLLRVAWSKLGDWEAAEDVVQETFLAAYAARETYNPQFAFRTWLWTILLNLCRRQWRKGASRKRAITQSIPHDEQATAHPQLVAPDSALSQLLATEQRREVSRLIDQLPEPQADAIRLRFFGGLKYEEIASAMDSALSTAKVRVRNGLLRLANILKEQEADSSEGS